MYYVFSWMRFNALQSFGAFAAALDVVHVQSSDGDGVATSSDCVEFTKISQRLHSPVSPSEEVCCRGRESTDYFHLRTRIDAYTRMLWV